DSGGDQFFFYGHGSAGNVSEVVVPRRGAAIDPVSLYVWRPAEDRVQRFVSKGALRQNDADPRWLQWIHDHRSGNRPGVAPLLKRIAERDLQQGAKHIKKRDQL